MQHDVDFVRAPERTVAVARFHVPAEEMTTIGDQVGEVLEAVLAELVDAGVEPGGPALSCYTPVPGGYDVASGFPVPSTFTARGGLERLDLEPVTAAHTTHTGSYRRLAEAYEDLLDGVAGAGRAVREDAAVREEYWSDPGTPDDQARTEIYWPVHELEQATA